MNTYRNGLRFLLAAFSATLLIACAKTSDAPEAAKAAPPAVKLESSFYPQGQAGLDRLQQNTMQKICSEYEGKPVPDDLAKQIIAEATATVRFPADGNYFGDWKNGQKIAKTGTGLQSSDDPAVPNGGNCYACHQMAAEEMAYGTLGLSLAEYGKLRGSSEPTLKYTWTRLWNAHAFNPCSPSAGRWHS